VVPNARWARSHGRLGVAVLSLPERMVSRPPQSSTVVARETAQPIGAEPGLDRGLGRLPTSIELRDCGFSCGGACHGGSVDTAAADHGESPMSPLRISAKGLAVGRLAPSRLTPPVY
jgi:hypothetical protein